MAKRSPFDGVKMPTRAQTLESEAHNRDTHITTREEEFAKRPRREQARAKAQELREGWPRDVNAESAMRLGILPGHRTSQEMPRAESAPSFGPMPVNRVIRAIAEMGADYAIHGSSAPSVTDASPAVPPKPRETSRFREIAQRIEESERTPQLRVRSATPKKG